MTPPFVADPKDRFGKNVIEKIASGDDHALAVDFANGHPSVGLSLREVEAAKENLKDASHDATPQRERDRDRDDDREL